MVTIGAPQSLSSLTPQLAPHALPLLFLTLHPPQGIAQAQIPESDL